MESEQLQIRCPDDFHLHVRDGVVLKSVVPHTARQFSRAIIMPNLTEPVTTVERALEYRREIQKAVPVGVDFQPLMTLYLTEDTPVGMIQQAKDSGIVYGLKLYPAGATTNSSAGVSDVINIYPVLDAMQSAGLPLLVHGEVTNPDIDVFDREKEFIETVLAPLLREFPELKVVMEHITTQDAAEFVTNGTDNLAATITAHHLLMNRNAIFAGGIRPHHYCLPVLKREEHRLALVKAATSGNPKFFLGTDSAPHPRHVKESNCGCAGIYTAYHALELYVEAFEQADNLGRLEAFASHHGADFYGLPRNKDTVTLEKMNWEIPDTIPMGDEQVVPLRGGGSCQWKLMNR